LEIRSLGLQKDARNHQEVWFNNSGKIRCKGGRAMSHEGPLQAEARRNREIMEQIDAKLGIQTCPECNGTGLLSCGTDEPCDLCHGFKKFSKEDLERWEEPGCTVFPSEE